MKTLEAVVLLVVAVGLSACGGAYHCTNTLCDPSNPTSKPYAVCSTGAGALSYDYGNIDCQCADKTNCSQCEADVKAWCLVTTPDGGTDTCVPTSCTAAASSKTYQVCSETDGSGHYDYGRFTCQCTSTTDCAACDAAAAAWCNQS